MEMVFLVHLEILLDRLKKYFYIVVLFFVCSCSKLEVEQVSLTASNIDLEIVNGILLYKNMPFSGEIKSFDEINQTKNITTYFKGAKHGIEQKWYSNDSLAEVRYYTNGLKVGVHKSWWENGCPKFEYPYSNTGSYDGTLKEWYVNGQQVLEFNYKNGKESGIQRMWLANGNIRANYTVVEGERFGLIGLKKCYTVKTNNDE